MSVPAVIGRFVVGERVGAGAFATVYRADDPALESSVAIKVLADNFRDNLDVRERFLREARLLRRVDADGVVRAHDVGELPDGRPYLVMTYADRGTLADRMYLRWPVAEAVDVAARLADAVEVLHAAGVLHRDIKPSNVLFRSRAGGREQLMLGDLGLGKGLEHASLLTMSGGTPGYMAPEQAVRGAPLSKACDVYRVCAVLYHQLTGQPPRDSSNLDEVARGYPVPPAAQLRPDLPIEVADVLGRGLDQDSARRWPTAGDLARALRAVPLQHPAELPAGQSHAALSISPSAGPSAEAPTVIVAAAPPTQPRVDPAGQGLPSGRSRRRNWWLIVGAVLVLGVPAGVGTTWWVRPVTLHDASGELSVTVPRAWSAEVNREAWDLAPIGGSGRQPALTVADDLAAMGQRRSGAHGVFIGLLGTVKPETALAKFDWSTCTRRPDRKFEHGHLAGKIRQWACAALTVNEATLVAADGRHLLVQVIEPTDGNRATGVLESITVARASAAG